MKAARNYINALREALRNWTHWTEKGAKLDKQSILFLIGEECAVLRKLDAQEVKDAILEHGNNEDIEIRLKRLEEKLLPISNYIANSASNIYFLQDAEVSEAIARYRQLIEDKALELIKVYDECEKYIKPKNPTIIKALADPLLLSYFFDNKEVLKEYINFCLSDTNIKLKAMRAMELANKGKIKMGFVRKPLHDALEKIGLNVGSYPQWNSSVNLV